MAISFASAPGNLFNILGKLGLLIKQMQSYQASQKTNFTDQTNGAIVQLAKEQDVQALLGSGFIAQLNSPSAIGNFVQTVATAVINRIVFRDNPQSKQTLTVGNVLTSINEVLRQMKIQGQTILAMTITSTVSTAGAGGGSFIGNTINPEINPLATGTGAINVSTRRAADGVVLENSFGETITFLCSKDSYTGGAIAGNENFAVTGQGAETLFAFDWPLGSGLSTSITAINGNANNSGGNLLTNSGFDVWAGGAPNNFVIDVGSANVSQETGLIYDGASALKITGTGVAGTQTQLHQQFNLAAGTSGKLASLSQYSGCVWARRDAIAAGAGTAIIDLVDQNGNVINDADGNANTTSINLTTLTAVYAPFTFAFRTPYIMPTAQQIRLRVQALDNGRSVFFDKLGFGPMPQLGTGNPFAAVHAGNVPFQLGDYGTVTVTNSRGVGGTLSTWQTLLFQLFPSAPSSEILWPSSSVPTIADALIG